MVTTAQGYALSISGLGDLPITLLDSESEPLLSARMSAARSVVVRIAPTEEGDVTGHDLAAAMRSVFVRLRLDEDDVEGHAIGVHFPTAEEANKFRKNLVAAGALAGTLVLAGAAGVGIASLPSGAATLSGDKPAPIERPVGRGFVAESVVVGEQPATVVVGPATIERTGIDEVTGKPIRSGVVQGPELERMPAGPGEPPTGGGPVEGR